MMFWSDEDTGTGVITVTAPDRAALLSGIKARFAANQGFSIATLNLDHVVKLARDEAFREAYAAHTHVTADGNPIIWLSKLAGQKDVKLIPGSELIDPVAEVVAEAGVSLALFGATEASLEAASTALQARYPGLEVALTLAPSMGFAPDGPEADEAIRAISDSGARMVFLALGAPKQERFAAYAQKALPGVGFLSIGAGLDFISGAQKRAPKLVRALALEWLWRLLGNPSRLAGRYWDCILILPRLTLRALSVRRQARVLQ